MSRHVLRGLLVALVLLQGWQAVRSTQFDLALRTGIRAYREGESERALTHFMAARRVRPGRTEAWTWQGDAAAQLYDAAPRGAWPPAQGRALLDRAWAGYAGAVLRCPPDSWSWSGLSEVAVRRARLEELVAGVDLSVLTTRSGGVLDPTRAAALAAARLAVSLKPAGFQELDVLGELYESTGSIEAAHEVYVRSARMMPAPSFHVWGRGRVLTVPLYRAVLQALREGISRAPEFEASLLHREVGQFARAQGDMSTALEHLEKAVATAGYDVHRYYGLSALGSALDAAGRSEEALSVLRRARDMGIDPTGETLKLGLIEMKLGRHADACRDLRTAVREDPGEEGLRITAARECERAGEAATAERILQAALVSPPDTPRLARELLELHVRAGRLDVARRLASEWARRHPEMPEFERWVEELR